MASRNLFSSLDFVFFDTTSISFEGEGGETLGERGHTKDHRPDLKQMVVGAVIDGTKAVRSAASCGRKHCGRDSPRAGGGSSPVAGFHIGQCVYRG